MHENRVSREFERRVKQGKDKLTGKDAAELASLAFSKGPLEQNELGITALYHMAA